MLAVVQEVTGEATSDVIFRWATLLTVQGVILAGIIAGYFSTRHKVAEVKTLAEPTGNGHAKRMENGLKEIKEYLDRVEHKVDTHIQDHASSSLRDNHDRVLQARRNR
jgi:esterase/lipase